MELKEFIKTTLVDIVEGIELAQNELKSKNCVINPAERKDTRKRKATGSADAYIGDTKEVEFEVALSQIDSAEGKFGLGVWFANIGAGGQTKTDEQNSSVTNIKFSVPIIYTTKD